LVREFTAEHPLVDLRVFRNRNFAIGIVLMTSLAAILYGTTAELPLFLQTLMGYPALQSGYAMSPRGIAAFVTTFFMGRLVGRVRSRWLLCCGFTLLAVSSFMLSDITLQVSQMRVIWPSIVNGIAISFIFVPLTDPVFRERLAAARHALARHTDIVTAKTQAYSMIYQTLDHQAHLWAFVDNFRLFGLLALCGIPLIFLFKRVQQVKKPT